MLGYNHSVAVVPPRWTLISVLFSSVPLSSGLAVTLHEAALQLYQRDEPATPVSGELVTGRVFNLRKTMQLGAISGPAFEAKLETERGTGTVRYLITRQGLDLGMDESVPVQRRSKYLN
jgi:hypothetical protein